MTRASNARYPDEFKAEAVRLYRESGKTLRAVAENHDVCTNSRRERAKRHDIERATGTINKLKTPSWAR